jgi:rubrerythrin
MSDSPASAGQPESQGGDPVCWAHLLCPECGAIPDRANPERCPRCGAPWPSAEPDRMGG